MASRKSPAKVATPAVESLGPVVMPDGSPSDVTVTMLTGQPRPVTCSAFFALTGIGEAGCGRLPRHHGDHRPTMHDPVYAAKRTAKAAPRSNRKSAKAKAMYVTRGGIRYLLTPVEAVERKPRTAAQLAADAAGAARFAAHRAAAKGKNRPAKVKVPASNPGKTIVAAPRRVTRRERSVTSGAPSAHLA